MPSFDIVSEVNRHELTNAVDQANREVETRFDFKGTNSKFELAENKITLTSQSEFQLQQMMGILRNKLSKRDVDVRAIKEGKPEMNLNQAKLEVEVQQGIKQELAKKITKMIKESKLKVQASIQGEQIRVTGKKRDNLQEVIAMLRKAELNIPLQFENFRD